MPSPAPEPAARTERSRRTRAALLDAVVALVGEGDDQPSARAIAERAGISTRSVFTHFESLEALHAAVVDRATTTTIGLLHPIDPALPLADRVLQICQQRALVNREIGPLRRAASNRLGSSEAIDAARAFARTSSVAQIRRVFATELATVIPPFDAHLVATVDALLAGESWDLLADTHGLRDDAVDAVAGSLLRLLRVSSDAAPTADRTDPGPRIERLLDAIEAGTPPELVVPRLRRIATPPPPRPAAGPDTSAP